MPDRNLAAEIFQLMHTRRASRAEGIAAMVGALVTSLMIAGVGKERVVELVADAWDEMEPSIRSQMNDHWRPQ